MGRWLHALKEDLRERRRLGFFFSFFFSFSFLLPIDSPSAASLKVGQSLLPQHESLLLHPAVLEPDLDLLVTEVQTIGEFPPPLPGDEFVQHKFTF